MSTSNFFTLYTKILHDKLFTVLNSIIEFAFWGGTGDKIFVLHNNAYWIKISNKINGNRYSLTFLKQALKYLFENCFFKVDSQIFWQVIGIPVASDLASFFANLFLFHYKSECVGKKKNIDYQCARMFGHGYRFIS